jgi:hypothetical protein
MVIISDRNGQLCNRLFHFSYFIANAIEYHYKVSYPCFDEYCEFFESTSANNFFDLQVSTKITPFRIIDKAILKYLKKYPPLLPRLCVLDIRNQNDIYDLKNGSYQNLIHKKVVFTKGWLFKDEENLKKHRKTLRDIFKPKEQYLEKVETILSQLRKKYDRIVGIHIRRGDYRLWRNGIYYFADEIYVKKMEEINKEINSQGSTCCFLICSNEDIDKNSFIHLNTSIEKRHFITDLYALAGCDYILGPPSTFGYWASFYGNVPLLLFEDIDANVSLDRFSLY